MEFRNELIELLPENYITFIKNIDDSKIIEELKEMSELYSIQIKNYNTTIKFKYFVNCSIMNENLDKI